MVVLLLGKRPFYKHCLAADTQDISTLGKKANPQFVLSLSSILKLYFHYSVAFNFLTFSGFTWPVPHVWIPIYLLM